MTQSGQNYWSPERWRFLLVVFSGVLGGAISGYWQASFIVALLVYIVWLLYKLQQLHSWLEQGGKITHTPDNNGIWERITYHILNTKKQSTIRKQRMSSLLKRFQGIITSLPYATVVLNGKNEIDWANKTSSSLLRLNLKTDRGQRIENLFRVPKLHKLLEKNKQKEIEISSPYNPQIKLAIQLIPIEKDLKLLIARDISERVHLQEMRKNFIANASHELRTPLTVIAGYLEIMHADEALPDSLRIAVESASEQSSRMQDIIEDLLTLSRLENSELNENRLTEINVAQIVETLCSNEQSLDENAHKLIKQLDHSLMIKGNELEITSVCANLIHNAIRYTPAGTKINIIWRENRQGEAVFTVADKGEGIGPEHISHLTERFYRVDKGRSRDAGGTGLGLAIVQHIMQRHGGRLYIQSRLGQGSTFSAIFPQNFTVRRSSKESSTVA